MYKNKKILALIPARGGSKGLPGKNIRPLLNKPLIAWTIEAALRSSFLDKVVVSSNDEAILNIALQYKAEVIKRPMALSADNSLTIDAVKHALGILADRGFMPDSVVVLQPTSPLRNNEDIDTAIKLFYTHKCISLVSVCKDNPCWSLRIKNEYIKPLFNWSFLNNKRRQDLPELYRINGAIYISTAKGIKLRCSLLSKDTFAYVMPQDRSVDIDNKVDLEFAELLIRQIQK